MANFFDSRGCFEPVKFAEHLTTNPNHVITLRDTRETFYFNKDKGIWDEGETRLQELFTLILGENARKARFSEVFFHVQANTYKERAELEPPINLICLENGILDLNTLELAAHDPKYFFRNRLPVAYDPTAKCPAIIRFFDSFNLERSDLLFILRFFSYCLLRHHNHKISLLLVGEHDCGKSKIISLLRAFLGTDNVSARSLQDLCDDRFATNDIYLKLLNADADLQQITIKSTANFKKATGGDMVTAQRKMGQPYFFVPYAKHLWSANKLPKPPRLDDPDSFFTRIGIIKFKRVFTANDPDTDPDIISKITTPQELSGLLNLLLPLVKEIEEKGFEKPQNIKETTQTWLAYSDSISRFVLEQIEVGDSAGVKDASKELVWDAYLDFCEGVYGDTPASKGKFTNEFPTRVKQIKGKTTKPYKPGKRGDARLWRWEGITVKTSEDDAEETQENKVEGSLVDY